ncbi:uncharacterized protein BCR38DRAFT_461052 [Pseudomassariella vexata]|uniref:Hemerythrin-like domain-containing protein n=1 Tax=Pseudomassariella vexata TaxID=1141098 RepID=A0A1Y2DER9_9PEZI|nr:uncharacterized protein BCR38DRAFT_461052 [Pseudomassariella vexata]ORY57758.1 hypothetical protein BCR38DRAFT_461052 [Pseudomassariella vexata]
MDPPVRYQPRGGILSKPLYLAIPILIALFFTRSPYFMATTAPSEGKPWADTPIRLITTPQYETKRTDIFTTGATHMALLHNSILRGYNSIYQQAPHVQPDDKHHFIGYCLTWFKFVKTHHDDEEETLFTKVAAVLDDASVWQETHKEHEAFLSGLVDFQTYLTSLKSPVDFSGTELQRIMSTFQEPFDAHFHSEISTIANLANHPNAPKPGSPEEVAAAATFKSWGKSTVTKAGTLDVVPFFLLNLDGTTEDGMWANWPPIPAPIKWGLVNIAGSYNWGWWKFSSCANGVPKELYALPSTAS